MCKQCQTNPVYEFTNKRKLCRACFIRYFQKKVLYTIRKFGLIKKNDVIGYKNKKDFREVVLEDVLKMFAEKSMVDLVKLSSKKKIDKIAVASTIDLETSKIIHTLIYNKINELKEVSPIEKIKHKIIIKPLYLFLDEEVLLYASLKNLKFTKNQIFPKDKISKFINELEEKHPEVKRAVVNSYLKLYNQNI
jgi:tRNA(Ile)-lysidine synthase TilS/MesJ